MSFRVIFNIILAAVWAAVGVVLLIVAQQQQAQSADNIRLAGYLAFLMVLWNLLRAFLAFRKAKRSDDNEP